MVLNLKNMKFVVLIPLIIYSQLSIAGPYSDELTKCLVGSTSESDRTNLIKWMFTILALHPEVKSMSAVTDEQRVNANKTTAHLFQRLITESCAEKTKLAVQFEGPAVMEQSFNQLGQIAGRGLMTDPAVSQGMIEMVNYLDQAALNKAVGLEKQAK